MFLLCKRTLIIETIKLFLIFFHRQKCVMNRKKVIFATAYRKLLPCASYICTFNANILESGQDYKICLDILQRASQYHCNL